MASGQGEGIYGVLVVCIVITVGAGVTAGLMYSNMSQAHQDADALRSQLETAKNLQKQFQGTVEQFKQLTDTGSLADKQAVDNVTQLAQKYGPAGEKNLASAIRMLDRKLNDVNDQLNDADKKRRSTEKKYVDTQNSLKAKITVEEKARRSAEAKVAVLDRQNSKQRKEFQDLNQQLREQRATAMNDLRQVKRDFEEMQAEFTRKLNFKQQHIDSLTAKVKQIETAHLQRPDGKIVRSDASHDYVYVDLGSKHRVKPGFTFSVYGYDKVGNPYHKPKAKIEIKHIQGPDLCTAIITEFDPNDPIVRNDLVYSPLYDRFWTERYAIAGKFDLDGDKKDDRDLLVRLIRNHGGIVVCELTDDGTVKGRINVDTNWLLLGETPTDEQITAATDEKQAEITKMLEKVKLLRQEAKDLGVSIINKRDFLNYMGYATTKRLTLAPTIR